MIKNFLGHLRTITAHRHLVMVHCFKAGIVKRGLLHDLSKYSPAEFIPGVIYFQGNRSPNEKEREVNGFSLAWIHHKGRNKHHFEYWTDYSTKTGRLEPVRMPDEFIFEMFCDRVSASKIYMKDKYTDRCPLDYFLRAKKKRAIEKVTSRKLEFLLRMLADKGEDYTFRYIRHQVTKIKESEK